MFSKTFTRTITYKSISHNNTLHNTILNGIDLLTDTVAYTLGPKGRNVVLERQNAPPMISKDGVTIIKQIVFSDSLKNVGCELIKKVADNVNNKVGDGTTTTTVLTRAIYKECTKSIAAGLNPMDLRKGILLATNKLLDVLTLSTKEITTTSEIMQVAIVSTNGDRNLGKLIALAMDKVGKYGVINVAEGKTMIDDIEFVEGLKFERGFISPYFGNPKTGKCEFNNPYILLCNSKITSVDPIIPILEQIVQVKGSLVILAEDVDGEALAALVINKLKNGLKVVACRAPGFGDKILNNLEDIAAVTGGQVINFGMGMNLEDTKIEQLGRCSNIVVTKDDTLIIGAYGDPAKISDRILDIKEELKLATRPYEIDKLNERIAKLSGGVAIIKVGGTSEIELTEKKERLTDALCATKAAVEEGIVIGGGLALAYASQALDDLKVDNFDQQVGIRIVRDAVRIPAETIFKNAGMEGAMMVGNLIIQSKGNQFCTYGMNVQTGEYVDMIASGIIDPLKIVKSTLLEAASTASLLSTSQTAIVEESSKKL